MQHPVSALEPEYSQLMTHCMLKNPHVCAGVAHRLLQDVDAYQGVEKITGVPALWLMATNERESSGNLKTYLGNGEPLARITHLVPRGRGPFFPPNAWVNGATDALHLDHIDQIKNWDWPTACYEWELWNGFGYRDFHHEHTPYLWGGTTVQQEGKYTGDGHFDPNTMDTQLGAVAIARAIVALRPDLDMPGWPTTAQIVSPPLVPAAVPVGLTGGVHGTLWVQHALNVWGAKQIPVPDWLRLVEDGNFGRVTSRAVRAFQAANGLDADGLAGPKTIPVLESVVSHLQA